MKSVSYPHGMVSHSFSALPDASQFERHCHNGYELLFVLRGEGDYIVEGTQYPLRSDTLLLLRPWEYHYVRPAEGIPYERYVIHFDASVPIDAAAHLPLLNAAKVKSRGVYFSSETLMQKLLPVFRMLHLLETFQVGGNASAKGETLVRTVVTQILMLLSLENAAEDEASSHSLVSQVIDCLNSRLQEEITLDSLAQEFYISKYYLCRIFRQYTGMPLMTYLGTKRIALAQQLLEQGNSAAETASLVGFRDYSSFYRAFCKQTGHSPAWARTVETQKENVHAEHSGSSQLPR